MVIKKLFEEFNEDIIRCYIQENADYYLTEWKLMLAKNSKTSWNWPAFLVGSFWMVYRKMYFYFFILMSIYILLNTIFLVGIFVYPIFILLFLFLLFMFPIFVGRLGNYIYAMHVYKKLKAFKSQVINEKDVEKLALLKGGVSVVAPILLPFIIAILTTVIFTLVIIVISIILMNI